MTRTTPPSLDDPPPGTSSNSRTQFAFIPRFIQQQQQQQQQPPLSASTSSSQQQQQTFGQRFKAALPFPRFYSGPSATIGPITPPITFHDPSNSSAFSSSSTSTSSASILPSPLPTPTSTSCRGIGESAAAAAQKPTKRRRLWDSTHVIHDAHCCMFRITLDSKGTIGKILAIMHSSMSKTKSPSSIKAALCYLPTRFQGLIEFYHTVSHLARRKSEKKNVILNNFSAGDPDTIPRAGNRRRDSDASISVGRSMRSACHSKLSLCKTTFS